MMDRLPHPDLNFDRQFWRRRAHHAIMLAFSALESGRVPFGGWERLFLSAAIDNFRDRHFERSARSAQGVLSAEHKSQPFPGRFSQEKGLADCRAEYEELVRPRR